MNSEEFLKFRAEQHGFAYSRLTFTPTT
jgi:hypothetical protein